VEKQAKHKDGDTILLVWLIFDLEDGGIDFS
jgi:hypothetical protein